MPRLVPYSDQVFEQYQLMRAARNLRPAFPTTKVGVFLAFDDEDQLLSGCTIFVGNTFAYVEDFVTHPDADPEEAVLAMGMTIDYLKIFATVSGLMLRMVAENEAVGVALKRKAVREQQGTAFVFIPEVLPGKPPKSGKKKARKAKTQ